MQYHLTKINHTPNVKKFPFITHCQPKTNLGMKTKKVQSFNESYPNDWKQFIIRYLYLYESLLHSALYIMQKCVLLLVLLVIGGDWRRKI